MREHLTQDVNELGKTFSQVVTIDDYEGEVMVEIEHGEYTSTGDDYYMTMTLESWKKLIELANIVIDKYEQQFI